MLLVFSVRATQSRDMFFPLVLVELCAAVRHHYLLNDCRARQDDTDALPLIDKAGIYE
jgi:hypothetical protein